MLVQRALFQRKMYPTLFFITMAASLPKMNLGILLVLLLNFTTLMAAESKFSNLTQDDMERLNKQRRLVLDAVRQKYGVQGFSGKKSDLDILQKLLDDHVFKSTQTYELQSMGIVLGDVLAAELGLNWVIVSDEYGVDPTLRLGVTTYQFNALTMISKRVERGEAVNIHDLFDQTSKYIEKLKRSEK